MRKYLVAAIPLLTLALLTLACDGNGKGDGVTPPTLDSTPTATATSGPTGTQTQQPSPTAIEETAVASETPTTEPTATPPAGSPTPRGTPAIAPADLSLYEGIAINQEECLYDPRTALSNCMERGLYSVEPSPSGEDISCNILIVEGDPVVILCRSQQPQQAVYYAIQDTP